MNVRVRICFESPSPEDPASMRSLACDLTNCPDQIRVFADTAPGWLVADFTMPDEAQYRAVPRIDAAMRYRAGNRIDSTIEFPKSEAEQARAARKAEQRRARRRRARDDA